MATSSLVLNADEDWPIKEVTVYEDQAQVTRVFDFKPKENGTLELKLEGLSDLVDSTSVRVEVAQNATVYEISCSRRLEQPENTESEVERKKLVAEKQKLENELQTLNEKSAWLKDYARKLVPAFPSKSGSSLEELQAQVQMKKQLMSTSSLEGFSNFLSYYLEKDKSISEEQLAVQKSIKSLDKELVLLDPNKSAKKTNTRWVKDITTLLSFEEVESIEIRLLYLVKPNGAKKIGWEASYDVRVEKATNSMLLKYFGKVVNGSGEDWVNVSLSLSTARPSIAGSLPELPRAEVLFKGEVQKNRQKKKKKKEKREEEMRIRNANQYVPTVFDDYAFGSPDDDDDDLVSLASYSDDGEEERRTDLNLEEANVAAPTQAQTTGGSSVFRIERLATIASDDKPHRQVIASIPLQPIFTYVASPKVSEQVYLRCSTRNTSTYPFLAGKNSIFMDGSFITKSDMQIVSPSEPFDFYLGVDDTVKLVYNPETRREEKFAAGLTKKAKKTLKSTRNISMVNTTSQAVDCLIWDQIPLSQTSEVKVKVLKPELKRSSKHGSFKVNAFSHFEGRKKVPASSEWSFTLEYEVEYPHDKEIRFWDSTNFES